MFSTLWWILQPSIDALTAPGITFTYRWRLLLLQPLTFITWTLISLPHIFTRTFTTIHIPNRHGHNLRTLIYLPKRRRSGALSPLHISLHSGGFIGGFPETQLKFNKKVVEATGAVVVAPHYRLAPKYPFPAAIDDVDDIVKFCVENGERLWGADPKLLTVDGMSAGGNLALALSQREECHAPAETGVKASVTFYAPIDLRLQPTEKPRPNNYPKKDPMAVFMPLYDAYAGPVRARNMTNPRLSPVIAEVEKLPERMLLIVPSIDILVHEQLTFVERVKRELAEKGLDKEGRVCEARVIDGAFHGWLELPYLPKGLKQKQDACYEMGVRFLKETHEKYGWYWNV